MRCVTKLSFNVVETICLLGLTKFTFDVVSFIILFLNIRRVTPNLLYLHELQILKDMNLFILKMILLVKITLKHKETKMAWFAKNVDIQSITGRRTNGVMNVSPASSEQV